MNIPGRGDKKPNVHVSWLQAVEFCNALSDKEGRDKYYVITDGSVDKARIGDGLGYRLPYEKEWEYAAGGGAEINGYKRTTYAGTANLNELRNFAYYYGNGGGLGPADVKTGRNPNALDLYDMSGNAYEWVYEYHPTKPTRRIVRGGCFSSFENSCAVAYRFSYLPNYNGMVGFRIVRSVR